MKIVEALGISRESLIRISGVIVIRIRIAFLDMLNKISVLVAVRKSALATISAFLSSAIYNSNNIFYFLRRYTTSAQTAAWLASSVRLWTLTSPNATANLDFLRCVKLLAQFGHFQQLSFSEMTALV